MAPLERLTSVESLRSWTDQIPFHYEYTAGVAGERFLRGFKDGRILASACEECGKRYVPPKMYCTDCFVEIRKYEEVGPAATVAALAESYVDFEGKALARPRTFAFVTFKGATGGLIHYASGKGLGVGSAVAPRFREKGKRTGTVLDIEEFVVR